MMSRLFQRLLFFTNKTIFISRFHWNQQKIRDGVKENG